MKKTLLLLTLVGLLSSCAFFKSQKANWEACKADPQCLEQAKGWQSKTELASNLVLTGAATVVPGAAVAIVPGSKAIGWIGFALAMLLGGHALTKKKPE